MRILSIVIASDYDGGKVKDVLSKRLFISDTLCSKLKRRSGSILLNGSPAYVTVPVKTGDRITAVVSDMVKDPKIRPIPLPVSVVYEDEDLLIVNKPSGIAVHPARDPEEITLENALAAYLGPDENPHPVSRLDKGTSGLMTVAKSGWAHSWMKTLQNTGDFRKTYLALCIGAPSPSRGIIDAPIGFAEGSRYRMEVRPDGLPSVTEYEVLQEKNGLTLVRLQPKTGRMHQIRVHMAYIGCPLLGDWLYGTKSERIDRPALHASEVSFCHPLLKQAIRVFAPLPEDMQSML